MSTASVKKAHEHLRGVVARARALGHRSLDDGTELVGRVQHVAPEAWLHIIFRPLDGDEITELEGKLGRSLPDDYREWLGLANGVSLFSDALSLDGLRTDYTRDPIVHQPYDLTVPNVDERPPDAEPTAFFIGGYGFDGSIVYLAKDGTVIRCTKTSVLPLTIWSSFDEFLTSEADRLSKLFDERGVRLADATTPEPVR